MNDQNTTKGLTSVERLAVASVAVKEMLLQPEYGNSFMREAVQATSEIAPEMNLEDRILEDEDLVKLESAIDVMLAGLVEKTPNLIGDRTSAKIDEVYEYRAKEQINHLIEQRGK